MVQVLRDPDVGDTETILAAVGQLQFEVFAYRLGSEFGAPTEIRSAPYQAIRADRQAAASSGCATSAGSASWCAATAPSSPCSRTATACSACESDEPELTLEPILAGT